MTCEPTSLTKTSFDRVFLDANVLAKPVTRTLLMAGGPLSGFRVTWSQAAEQEASRHMRPREMSPSVIRERFGFVLSPSGVVAGRFVDTSVTDRQILADVESSGARFLITEDVDDFAEVDLVGLGISAVNPDLFLSLRLTRAAYSSVIEIFVRNQVSPPTTSAEFHSAIARQHPRLFAAFADLYAVEPKRSNCPPPAVVLRGQQCPACDTSVGVDELHCHVVCHAMGDL